MNIINKKLSLEEFKAYISSFNFSPLNPNKIVVHHSASPTQAEWKGSATMLSMKSFYEGKGWPSGPHLYIEENGIWLFTPMNVTGTHAKAGNTMSIGIEVIGNYTSQVWQGKTKENVLGVIHSLMDRLKLSDFSIRIHREYSQTQCPGNMITREWIINELNKYIKPQFPKEEEELRIKMDIVNKALDDANQSRIKLFKAKGKTPDKKYTIKDEPI